MAQQAHAPPQPPVIEHPDTGLPTWFCNIHSHSALLRDERDGVLPETTGASRVSLIKATDQRADRQIRFASATSRDCVSISTPAFVPCVTGCGSSV